VKKSAAVAALEKLRLRQMHDVGVAAEFSILQQGRREGIEKALECVKALDTLTDKTEKPKGETK
jgi:hypothetical protein